MIIYVHESFPFRVAKLIQGYDEWAGDATLRFPDEVHDDPYWRKHWMRHIQQHLKPDQKPPFILALDDGRRKGFSSAELKQSKCSFVLFESRWADYEHYEWAWKTLKSWGSIREKCQEAYEANRQCKIAVRPTCKLDVTNL